MASIVEIRNLQKRFSPNAENPDGFLAVKGIDLTIEKGEIFSLLGPNGAGKSTTILMMSGLLAPTAGEITIGGHMVAKSPMAVKAMIGVVPQEIALYPELTARQNLEFFGQLYGLSGKDLAKRCDEVLEFVGLTDRQREVVNTFSGGMKRRVNIAVGLLHKPALVFMDEPTVGVDPQSRRGILDAVKQLNSQGMTVLYTTHYMEEAQELSNRVGIIDHGKLIACGTQSQLLQQVGQKDAIIIRFDDADLAKAAASVQTVEGIASVQQEDHKLTAFAARGRQALPRVLRALDEAKIFPVSIEIKEPDLETVFLGLTGRALRD
jgi:ABC-2 type transport system ATP-binding protein